MPVTISGTGSITGAGLNKKIEAFTASGTWTVPAGVTYAIAHMIGGGGGAGVTTSGGNGSDSSVAFASGTVTATGGTKALLSSGTGGAYVAAAGNANSGQGAQMVAYEGIYRGTSNQGGAGAYIVAGADVTPAASITVTVGAGGTAGTGGAAGGSGYVFIEYYNG